MLRNYRARIVVSVVWVLLLLIVAVPAFAETAAKMPDFQLERVGAEGSIASRDFKGKVVLVNLWSAWCPPCRQEIPSLVKLHNQYHDQGFSVLGLSVSEGDKAEVESFVAKLDVNYPMAFANRAVAMSFGNVIGLPTSFLVDRQGAIVKYYLGYTAIERLQQDIEPLLVQQ